MQHSWIYRTKFFTNATAILIALFFQTQWVQAQSRDPKQLTLFISDFDDTFARNMGNFVVELLPNPGILGLGEYRNLPARIEVPIQDFEGVTNRNRIRDLLGSVFKNQPAPYGAFDEIKLSNGQTIIPAFYYLDPIRGYEQFRSSPTGRPEEGHLYRSAIQKLNSNTPFLLDAAPFLALTFAEKYKDQLTGVFLTYGGRSQSEMSLATHTIAKELGWGNRTWSEKSFVNLSNPAEAAQFSNSKTRYTTIAFDNLSRRVMSSHAVPHFLVVLENDPQLLKEQEQTLRNLANSGLMANPVVPILISFVEDEVLKESVRKNWNQSVLESSETPSRVKIFWPSKKVETSNEYSRVLELTLGLNPKEAKSLYELYDHPLRCSHTLAGRTTSGSRR